MEITSLVKNIYNRLIVFICLACIFSACVEKECITYKHVLVGIELIQDTSNTVYTADSITVKGVGSDEIIYDNAKKVTVKRVDSVFDINIPSDIEKKILKSEKTPIDIQYPFVIEEVTKNSIAEQAKLKYKK